MSTAILAPTNQSEIIVRALNARSEELSSEVARFFLSFQLAPNDVRRANVFAEKARQGTLTPAEEHDLDEYRRSLRFVDCIKLKARLILSETA